MHVGAQKLKLRGNIMWTKFVMSFYEYQSIYSLILQLVAAISCLHRYSTGQGRNSKTALYQQPDIQPCFTLDCICSCNFPTDRLSLLWRYFSLCHGFPKKAFYGTVAIRDRDIGFEYLTYWLSQLVNLKGYWFVLCSLYILPVFFALKKRFKQQYAVALVLFVCSLSFWGYGVNGLRNGIATSLVIFSFLVPNNDIKRIPVWIIACLFHQSVMLPIGCFLLTRLSNNPKHYLYLWGTFFLLMLVARDSFSTLLTNIPWFEQDKRMSEYLNMSYKGMEQMFSNIGFRWDFIIYSLIPIIAGVKYIYTYCYEDKLFIRLFNTYIASNAFWLLTIHVPYNNRFAYLSWFLYPIVLIYPLLKDNLINNQGERIKWIILCYYMFTYVMWIK